MSNPTLPLRPENRVQFTTVMKPVAVNRVLEAKLDRLMLGALTRPQLRNCLE